MATRPAGGDQGGVVSPPAAEWTATSSLTCPDTDGVHPAPGRRSPFRRQSACQMFYSARVRGFSPPGCLPGLKQGGQSVYQGSPQWGRDLLLVLLTCWKMAGSHQTARTPAFQTRPCFRLRSDESWELEQDQRWFSVQPCFFPRLWDKFQNNSLDFFFFLKKTTSPRQT